MDFDLAENVFYFHNGELKSLEFVLDYDTEEKFYWSLLTVSIDIDNIVVFTFIIIIHYIIYNATVSIV